MTQVKLSSETLWHNIRELYRWRKGLSTPKKKTFDLLSKLSKVEREEVAVYIPKEVMAFEIWRSHMDENTFFMLNEFDTSAGAP